MKQYRNSDFIRCFLSLCIVISLLFGFAWAEGLVVPEVLEVTLSMGTGAMPEHEPALPFADVYWWVTPDLMAEYISGRIIEEVGETRVEGFVSVEGIANPVQVVCTYHDGKMTRAAMILEEHAAGTVSFTEYPDMKALQAYVSDFFKEDADRYTYHGKAGDIGTRDIWMGSNTCATVGYFGSKDDLSLGVAFYPAKVFNRQIFQDAENVSAGSNQFFTAKPAGIEHELSGRGKSALLYNIQFSKANKERNDVPFYVMMFLYQGTVLPQGFSSMSFIIDDYDYSLSIQPNGEASKDSNGEYKQWVAAIIGPDSRPVLDALEKAAGTVKVQITANNLSLNFDLPEETRKDLVSGSRMMEEAGGWSGIYLDYCIDGESSLTITKWEEPLPSPTPEPEPDPKAAFDASASILPFVQLNAWNLTTKEVTKAIGGTVENVNKQEKVIRSVIDIPELGNGLPVIYIFTNNKLTGVTLIIDDKPDINKYPSLNDTRLGKATLKYYNSFGLQNALSYHGENGGYYILLSDRTAVALGYVRNSGHTSLGLKFHAPVKTNINIFKKAAGYTAWTVNEYTSAYSLTKPHYFKHNLTYEGTRYTYSYFVPQFAVKYPNTEFWRAPYMMFAFCYNGIKNPGQCKAMSFDIDGTVYRFTSIRTQTDSKTQYGEYSADFQIYMGPDNMAFMEALKKAKRTVSVTVDCEGFLLNFSMPKQSKQQLVQAYSLLEKSGGLNPIYMDYMYFEQTPMSEM